MSDTLSEKKRKELNDYYKKLILPACDKCGSNESVIPTVRGKPSSDLLVYAQEGHVKLSGCCHGYKGWCKKCETFIGTDE